MSLNLLNFFLLLDLINIIFCNIAISIKGNNPYEIYEKSKEDQFLKEFLYSAINNNLYSLMGIGMPEQNIVISIVPNQKDFLFSKKNCEMFYNDKFINKNKIGPNNVTIKINKTKIGYIKNLSKSFMKNNEIKLDKIYGNNFLSGKERLKFDDYRNILIKKFNTSEIIYPYSQNNLVKFSFVYEETENQEEEICGSIGLSPYNDKNNNKFIEQLKTSNITQNYYWSIKYLSLDRGYIIFGILPHEYDIKYNSSKLVETYNNFLISHNSWAIQVNELFFYSNKNEKILINKDDDFDAKFAFNKQVIIGSLNYKDMIIKYFFKEYINNNICFEENISINDTYTMIRCYENKFKNEIRKFPELNLYCKDLNINFILTYEDLFINLGNYLYFLIIFRTSGFKIKYEFWELGIPFLKKYQMIFNMDSKKIGYYIPIKEKKYQEKKNNNNKVNISIRTVIEIIIGVIFILIIIYFIKRLYYIKIKQKRPYELQDEDYDYFSNNNNDININNKNGKLIEMKKH